MYRRSFLRLMAALPVAVAAARFGIEAAEPGSPEVETDFGYAEVLPGTGLWQMDIPASAHTGHVSVVVIFDENGSPATYIDWREA